MNMSHGLVFPFKNDRFGCQPAACKLARRVAPYISLYEIVGIWIGSENLRPSNSAHGGRPADDVQE